MTSKPLLWDAASILWDPILCLHKGARKRALVRLGN